MPHIHPYAHHHADALTIVDATAFQLSRIYSRGWNAAKALVADGAHDADEKTAAALNPYRNSKSEEYTRWTKGFTDALQSRAVLRVKVRKMKN